MIVQRMTFVAGPGNRDEMVRILQELWKLWDHPPAYRIYLPITGPFDVIHQEIEFEDFEAREKFWTEGTSLPGFAPLMEKWTDLRDIGATNELLRLVE
jgi:hypothetical protein